MRGIFRKLYYLRIKYILHIHGLYSNTILGVFRFQGGFHYRPVDSRHLPFYPEVTPFQIKILPLEAQELSPPQAGGQFHIVEIEWSLAAEVGPGFRPETVSAAARGKPDALLAPPKGG